MSPARSTVLLAVLAMLATGTRAESTPVPVEVRPLAEVLVDLERSAPADVRALNDSTLAAQVAAAVSAVHADVGQSVKEGDVLIELDSGDYALALRQAEAGLGSLQAQKAQADARLKRARELTENQYLSDDELLARETDVMVIAAQIRAQEVSVDVARRNLGKCRVTAPFDGVVRERFAQVGAYVTAGNPLLRLTESDRFELDAEVADEIANSLERASSIRFVSRNESWPLRLLRVSPVVGTERRSRQARFAFVSTAPSIGRSGEVTWRVEKGLLPASLVVRRDGQLGVFLERNGKAAFTPLPGAEEGRPVPVDLPPGQRIVVAGRERLQHGDAIVPADSQANETR